jgi:hypothetical protein
MSAAGFNTDTIAAYTTGSYGIIAVVNYYIVPLVFTIALLIFLLGVAKAYIISANNETERAKGNKLIMWGILGFAVMLSVWGLVNLVAATLGLSTGTTAPTAPKSPTI